MKLNIINKSGFEPPQYETEGSAGFDIRACFENEHDCIGIYPGQTIVIPTGLYIAVPESCVLDIRSRSGLAAKKSLSVLNSPGTIDSDYRGEIKIILHNHSLDTYIISHGDKIAQGVAIPIIHVEFNEVETLDQTKRGSGGFGHTGK
jgi:dUTP pyrophosphatase